MLCHMRRKQNGTRKQTILSLRKNYLEVKEDFLISYSFVADIKIMEPSPDCDTSDRKIKIKNFDYSQPKKL